MVSYVAIIDDLTASSKSKPNVHISAKESEMMMMSHPIACLASSSHAFKALSGTTGEYQ
jgi:hypothetical protein